MTCHKFMSEDAVLEVRNFIAPMLAQFGVTVPLQPAFKECCVHCKACSVLNLWRLSDGFSCTAGHDEDHQQDTQIVAKG